MHELEDEDIEIIEEEYLEDEGNVTQQSVVFDNHPEESVDLNASQSNVVLPSTSSQLATSKRRKRTNDNSATGHLQHSILEKIDGHMDTLRTRDAGTRPSGFAIMLTERMAPLPQPIVRRLEMEMLMLVNAKLDEQEAISSI